MSETGTPLRPVAPEAALRSLRAAPDGGRGFLGLDPVVHNDAALTARLAARGAWLFTTGDGEDSGGAVVAGDSGGAVVLAAAVSPDNPRQAEVAVCGDAPGAVRELLEFLRAYRRCASFTARATRGSDAARVWEAAGFRTAGVLREHVYQGGAYHDVVLYHLEHLEHLEHAARSGRTDGPGTPGGSGGSRRDAAKGPVA